MSVPIDHLSPEAMTALKASGPGPIVEPDYPSSNDAYDLVLWDLRRKRNTIDRAIEAIEQLTRR
jgi:hypothetical protein